MALFAAYAEEANKNEPQKDQINTEWLENSSFKADLCLDSRTTDKETVPFEETVSNTHVSTHKKQKKKQKDGKTKRQKGVEVCDQFVSKEADGYFIETAGSREFLKVSTISWPAVPKYKIKYSLARDIRRHKKKKFKRFYQSHLDLDKQNTKIKSTVDDLASCKDGNVIEFKEEGQLSEKTASFNRHLAVYPCDIEKWLEYVQFQDTVYQFEKSYRKGSIAKAQRVLAERKLSILDKALSVPTNTECELLHRQRLIVAVDAFPVDELQIHLKKLVENDRGNIILWQGYIESVQCSMSHCNSSNVIELYSKCLATLHQLRRFAASEKSFLEESILHMLYQCGLFMKQAGLFEQVWTLLRLYLELNLSPNDKNRFNISSGFDEKHLVELEELIFTSQLPLHELWLRTEKLRESCHWLPYLDDDNCEDPQRLVFTEDVAELIHPITTPENIFKLTATVFSLLKIPLLPCRHTTMHDLGLDYVPWSLDSMEPLLSVFLPLYPVDITSQNIFSDNRLAVGPQYLKSLPGQEEYLRFILLVMKNCSECLTGNFKIAATVWLFRFQRLLIVLHKRQRLSVSDSFVKQIRKSMKEFLKAEENRQVELYYLEYALAENDLGHAESCSNIIRVALDMLKDGVDRTECNNFQATQCHLYRTLIHITLAGKGGKEASQRVIGLLCELVLKEKHSVLTSRVISEMKNKFQLVTRQILEQDVTTKLETLQHFLPNFFTDWIICHGWFIYINDGIEEFDNLMKETLATLEGNKDAQWQTEVLYEFYVAGLFKHGVDNRDCYVFKKLDDVLHSAIQNYPNNLFILAVLAKEQSMLCSMGPRWWKIQNLLVKSGRAMSTLFCVIILDQQMSDFRDVNMDTVTGHKQEVNINMRNRMLSLFKKITRSDMSTRRCGLIWRLYLQFVNTYFSPEICRNIYYSAVEECPWLKALYIDAAIYIPAELAQIQDLIIEKQLRLHVTPEELDILRN